MILSVCFFGADSPFPARVERDKCLWETLEHTVIIESSTVEHNNYVSADEVSILLHHKSSHQLNIIHCCCNLYMFVLLIMIDCFLAYLQLFFYQFRYFIKFTFAGNTTKAKLYVLHSHRCPWDINVIRCLFHQLSAHLPNYETVPNITEMCWHFWRELTLTVTQCNSRTERKEYKRELMAFWLH